MLLFSLTNIVFVVLIIYKNSRVVELSYQYQRLEKERALLAKEEQQLQQELCLIKSRVQVKKFAHNDLNMKQLTLKDIKRLPHDQRV
jgi:hypothetical protein